MNYRYVFIIIYTNASKFHGVIKKGHLGVMKYGFLHLKVLYLRDI
jgi:hypothetical protein